MIRCPVAVDLRDVQEWGTGEHRNGGRAPPPELARRPPAHQPDRRAAHDGRRRPAPPNRRPRARGGPPHRAGGNLSGVPASLTAWGAVQQDLRCGGNATSNSTGRTAWRM